MDKIERQIFLEKLKDKELLLKVGEQLIKDLNLCGLDGSELTLDEPVESLRSLQILIEHCLRTDPEKLRSFLYRVDLKEDELVQWSHQLNDKSLSEVLSKAVMLRELQKVLHRSNY